MKRIPELLSPAGTPEALVAAVESGADAVYMGGPLFNARMKAGNFSREQLQEAIDFCHKRGVKAHIAVNTLIFDDELERALSYAAFLAEAGADALIIQDYGLGALLHRDIPDLPLHLSTQASVYSKEGVEEAAFLGYERVVLARELSLDEIRFICASIPIEIEVFCHGAICICYSGQCQMSRALGGRSANRGSCAQACRLPYEEQSKGICSQSKSYPLSPADLCLLSFLPDLAEAGVSSLKIEGRMKSPEYVATVTSVYRKYLDLYAAGENIRIDKEDMEKLRQIFNRGFATGRLTGEEDPSFMSPDLPKHRGLYIGRVTDAQTGRNLVEASLEGALEQGDSIEFRRRAAGSDEGTLADRVITGNRVTYLHKGRKRGSQILGDVKEPVEEGDFLYRMSSKSLLDEARASFRDKDFHKGKYRRKLPLTAEVVQEEGHLLLTLQEPTSATSVSASLETSSGDDAHGDVGRDRVAGRLEKALRKTGGSPFTIEKIDLPAKLEGSYPLSELNRLRRQALEAMERALCIRRPPASIGPIPLQPSARQDPTVEFYFLRYAAYECFILPAAWERAASAKGIRLCYILPLAAAIRHGRTANQKAPKNGDIYYYISGIAHGKEGEIIRSHFDRAFALTAESGLFIGNIEWIHAFSERGIPLYTDTGLNISNQAAAQRMEERGLHVSAWSHELDTEDAAFPLMTIRHHLKRDHLVDRKGVSYAVVSRDFSDNQVIIRSGKVDFERALVSALHTGRPSRIYLW